MLAVERRLFGDVHEGVADSLTWIARLRESRRALQIRKEILGEEHSQTALSSSNLAAQLERLRRPKEALRFYQKALAIRTELFGKEHPDTADSLSHLAALHEFAGDGRLVKLPEAERAGAMLDCK